MKKNELLKSLFLFRGLDFTLLDIKYSVSDCVLSVDYTEGEVILSSESIGRGLAVLESGSAKIVTGEGARSVVLRYVPQGESFGAASLFRAVGKYNTRVVAGTDCRVLFLPKGTVERLCRAVPEIAVNYIAFLSDKITFLNRKISAFTAGSAEARLAVYLSELATDESGTITIDVSITALADMLGIGRASLYRSLDNLTESGIISRRGKKITLTDAKRLYQLIQ